MINVNNVSLTGVIKDEPSFGIENDGTTPFCIFKLMNQNYANDRMHTTNIKVKCYGNVANYVELSLSAGDKVLVNGTIRNYNTPINGTFLNVPFIYALTVTKLEQEMYK